MSIESPTGPKSQTSSKSGQHKWYQFLGPGLITGASDDDPSGIATYAQAGAMFAYGMLWILLFTYPLMAATQEISARVGRVTGRGLAGNMRRFYSPWLVFPIVGLLVIANVINIAADLGAMGACTTLIVHHGSPLIYASILAVVSLVLEVFVSYAKYARYLKWLCAALLVYVATVFFGHVDWKRMMIGTFIPHLHFKSEDISMLVAIVGTTISPYLFFWQASLETEEIKKVPEDEKLTIAPEQARPQFERIRLDTYTGMGISNLIGFSIMLAMAVTIGSSGGDHPKINSAADAASALGQAIGMGHGATLAVWLFSLGVIGTGMLAVPVLAGSAAYGVSEAVKWNVGLDRRLTKAQGFYGVVAAAILVGLAINFVHHIDPMQALVWAAIINGIVAVPVMAIMILIASNPKIMGRFSAVGKGLHVVGWIATGAMALTAIGLFVSWGA